MLPATMTVGESPATAPIRRRWPWILALSTGASLCVGLLAVGIMIGRRSDTTATPAANPATGIHASAPATAPTTGPSNIPGPGEALDGSYRFDVNRAQQTYNETPDPQPPNVSTWWAFHTYCTPTGCVATGTLLDDADHQRVSATGGDKPLVLDFRDSSWQSRPETVLFGCVGPNGTHAKQTTTQAIRLQQAHGALRGTMTVTVDSNECAQQGAGIKIPAVAIRVGGVPPGVEVPTPPTTTSAMPTTTSAPDPPPH
jgi:serine/threonine protein kinase, bacterial